MCARQKQSMALTEQTLEAIENERIQIVRGCVSASQLLYTIYIIMEVIKELAVDIR